VATASAAAKAAGHGAAGAAVHAAGSKVAVGVLVKWVGIAAVGGVATLGVIEHVQSPSEPSQTAAASIAPVAREAEAVARQVSPGLLGLDDGSEQASAEPSEPATAPDEPGTGPDPMVAEPAAVPPPRPRAAGAKAAEDEGDAGLGAEVQALDRARTAMQAGRSEAALRALADYEREFATGALQHEAEVLRIETLARAGRWEEARALADGLLARHPTSPHAQRIRSLLAGGASSPPGPEARTAH
jgi:hypothetical protein